MESAAGGGGGCGRRANHRFTYPTLNHFFQQGSGGFQRNSIEFSEIDAPIRAGWF